MNENQLLRRAVLLYQQANYDAAERELRAFLLQSPQDALGRSLMGLCLSHRKAFEEATQEAQMAIGHEPDLAFPHYALASILDDRNRYDEAAESVQVALRIEPDNSTFWGLFASIRLSQRRWQDALEAADQGLACDAEDASCGNIRAAALVKLGRHDEADKTIDGMLEKGPDNAHSHANLGWSLLHQGEYRKAREHFREALRLNPNLEWARAGMLEALKARNIAYRLLLRFFLAMSKLSRGGQWGIIVGLWLGYRVLIAVREAHPEWGPYLLPLIFVYLAFVALTWLGTPLFNLLLRFDPFGKYVLSAAERRETNVFGVMFGVALTMIVLACVYGGFWIWAAVFSGLMLFPVSATFRCQTGWPQNAMIVYTLLVALLGLASLFSSNLVIAFAIGCVGSSFVGNLLATQTPKK